MARHTKFKEEYKHICKVMCKIGAIDKDLAEACNVKEQTINNWKKDFPEFFESIKKGKDVADSNVEKSLYKRCTGYSHEDTKFATYNGFITDQRTYTKHYPPDTMAIMYWLNNRKPKDWTQRIDHTTKGDKITPSTIIVESQEAADNLTKAIKGVTNE